MPKPEFENRVTIKIWQPQLKEWGDLWSKEKEKIGHVALKTYKVHEVHEDEKGKKLEVPEQPEGIYVSFHPVTACCIISTNEVPTNFSQLGIPENIYVHACYIRVRNKDEVLYYCDSSSESIEEILVPEDKKDAVITAWNKLPKGVCLKEKDEIKALDDMCKVINHTPKGPVNLSRRDTTRKGFFRTYEEDHFAYGRAPDEEIVLFNLDVDKIHSAYKEYKKEKHDWDLFTTHNNCSGLVTYLLVQGGIKKDINIWQETRNGALKGAGIGLFVGLGILIGTGAANHKIMYEALRSFTRDYLFPITEELFGPPKSTLTPGVIEVPATILTIVFSLIFLFCLTSTTLASLSPTMIFAILGTPTLVISAMGAAFEYYSTLKLGEIVPMMSPEDVLKLVLKAKNFEKDNCEPSFKDALQLLTEECNYLRSKLTGEDKKHIKKLWNKLNDILERGIDKEIDHFEISKEIYSYLKENDTWHQMFFGKKTTDLTIDLFKRCDQLIREKIERENEQNKKLASCIDHLFRFFGSVESNAPVLNAYEENEYGLRRMN